MNGPIDKFLIIMRLVNDSEQPMTAQQIATETKLNIRTVQRHTKRLVDENLIALTNLENTQGYQFMKLGLNDD